MPRDDERRSLTGAEAPARGRSSPPVGQAIELPRPTEDQKKYLERIKRSTGQYDPDVIVGGPRRRLT
jgi:hypothetical protein